MATSTIAFDIDRRRLAKLVSAEITLAMACGVPPDPLKARGAPRPGLDERLDMAVGRGVAAAALALGGTVAEIEGTTRIRVRAARTFNRALKGVISATIDTLIINVGAGGWLETLAIDASPQLGRAAEAAAAIGQLVNERVRPPRPDKTAKP